MRCSPSQARRWTGAPDTSFGEGDPRPVDVNAQDLHAANIPRSEQRKAVRDEDGA